MISLHFFIGVILLKMLSCVFDREMSTFQKFIHVDVRIAVVAL